MTISRRLSIAALEFFFCDTLDFAIVAVGNPFFRFGPRGVCGISRDARDHADSICIVINHQNGDVGEPLPGTAAPVPH